MKWILLCSLTLFISHVLTDSDVLILTDRTFDDTIKNNPFVMVMFFAPWCGHCKAFAPTYEKAAAKIKEEGKPFVLAKLDATENTETATKEEIQGYPTIRFYVYGVPVEYDGERTVEDVIAFLTKKSKSPSTHLASKEEIEKVTKEEGRRCILATLDENLIKTYEDVAKKNQDYIFYHSSPQLLKEVFPEINENNVILLKDYDEGKVIYTNEMKDDAFSKFLDKYLIPLAGELDKLSVDAVFTAGGKTGIILFRDPSTEEGKKLDEEFKELATELKLQDYIFIKVDLKSEWGTRIADHFVIDEADLPVFEIAQEKEVIERYRLTSKLDKQSMKQFIQDWKEGKAPRFYKSEPKPENNNGPLYKVVATNFQELVMDNDDDILLFYHSHWCKHCKSILTTIKKLAESMTEFPKLKLMEIDGHKNDLKEHAAKNYPALKMFRGKNKKEVVDHQGPYGEHGIAVFIKESASHTIDIPELRAKDEGERNQDDL